MQIKEFEKTFNSWKKVIFHCALTEEWSNFVKDAEKAGFSNDLIRDKVVKYYNWEVHTNDKYCAMCIDEWSMDKKRESTNT